MERLGHQKTRSARKVTDVSQAKKKWCQLEVWTHTEAWGMPRMAIPLVNVNGFYIY